MAATKSRANIYLPEEVHQWYKDRASNQGNNMSALASFVLQKYMLETKYMEEDLPKFIEIAEKMGYEDPDGLIQVMKTIMEKNGVN
ncbi:hypothetical protein MKY22_17330 [Exiguobacterium sp. FSL W8-0210]|uniref:hypothetical protein n=1 Tax=Exiguobacterium sp. FSL W8-0210 TaxID=2921598 RepID=UPI0030F4D0BB